MILPAKRQLWGWGAVCVAVGLLLLQETPPFYIWGLIGLWLLVIIFSVVLFWREKADFQVSRQVGTIQQSGQTFTVGLQITSRMRRPLLLRFIDHSPDNADPPVSPPAGNLAPGDTLHLDYPLTINDRGRFLFLRSQVRYADRSGLWLRDVFHDNPTEIRIYPRFDHSRTDTAFVGIRTPDPGHIRPLHERSGNGDFSHLRDYLNGDSLTRIDHKASARHGKWLVREYEYEHEQPVLLLVDASRRQQTRYHGKTVFDELLNAATHLARAALKAGDEIGLQIFSDTPQTYLPCSRQSGQYRRFVETLFDRHADSHPPDFTAALHEAFRRQRRRALIILLTTLENGDEATLRPLLALLQKRHHLMLVNIRPPWLDGHPDNHSTEEALISAAAAVYDNEFTAAAERLQREKLFFIPTSPEQLRPQLLNAYLAYKNKLRK